MYDFYAIFDIENKGHITLREFAEVFDMFRIYPRNEFVRLAFRSLDKDLDGKISLHEFLENLCPSDKNYREVVLARKSYNEGTNFSRINSFTPDT
jgi:Ca2+-binding EF-hand superfamily protein